MNRAGVDLYSRYSLLHPCQCSAVPPLREKVPFPYISDIFCPNDLEHNVLSDTLQENAYKEIYHINTYLVPHKI